ncbi:porin family protein [Algibacter amylolyticus]|uniref:Porin family protein n=1 Tax=Algibacter amylolyticus TaxID=1608400 RepID=A0A5M7B4E5_9FLAO|nr:outer membrane beta-barrel protein [Algibacter amylolyticus]KAA5823650.1 porin family protein [Algibacter amylolyticus]MBB5267813.1 outer membrane protein [Algibacter amylolyticus]TSJ74138.1 porin family protein [Algibacter amylolyticus]
MKKLLIIAAVAVFGLSNVNAQDDAKAYGFNEGDVFLEGNIGFSSTNDKNFDEKTNSFTIAPKVGFFLNEDLAIGGQLTFNSFKEEVSGTDTVDNSTFGAGVFARYYFLDLGQRFKTFTEFGIAYATSDNKISDFKVNAIGASLDLGINYFVTEKIALTFGLRNVLGFTSTKADVDGAKAESNFNLGFGDVANPFSGNASFGLLYKL